MNTNPVSSDTFVCIFANMLNLVCISLRFVVVSFCLANGKSCAPLYKRRPVVLQVFAQARRQSSGVMWPVERDITGWMRAWPYLNCFFFPFRDVCSGLPPHSHLHFGAQIQPADRLWIFGTLYVVCLDSWHRRFEISSHFIPKRLGSNVVCPHVLTAKCLESVPLLWSPWKQQGRIVAPWPCTLLILVAFALAFGSETPQNFSIETAARKVWINKCPPALNLNRRFPVTLSRRPGAGPACIFILKTAAVPTNILQH